MLVSSVSAVWSLLDCQCPLTSFAVEFIEVHLYSSWHTAKNSTSSREQKQRLFPLCSSFICFRKWITEWAVFKNEGYCLFHVLHHGPDSIFTKLSCCLIAPVYEPGLVLGAAAIKPWSQSLPSAGRCSCSCADSSYFFLSVSPSQAPLNGTLVEMQRLKKDSPLSPVLMLPGGWCHILQSDVF